MTAPFQPSRPTLTPSLESSIQEFLRREEEKRKAQRLAPITITAEAPGEQEQAETRAKMALGTLGTPDVGTALEQDMATRRRQSLERTLGTVARSFVDPRLAFEAGQAARERVGRGAEELLAGESTTGQRLRGAGRVALGAGEAALNVLPAAGLFATTGRAGRALRAAPAVTGGVGGAVTGAAIAPEGKRLEGAAAGAVGGALLGRVAGQRSPRIPVPDAETRAAINTVSQNIDFSGAAKNLAQKGPSGQWFDQLVQRFAEGTRPIRQFGEALERRGIMRPVESPATALNQAYDSPATIKRALSGNGIVSPKTFERIGPSYREVFETVGQNPQNVRNALSYAVAKRVVGRGDEMALRMVGGDADKLNQYKQVVESLGSNPNIQQFEERLNAFTQGLRQYAVDAGLWTPELAQTLDASDALYIPFRRILEPTARAARPTTATAGRATLKGTAATPRQMVGGMQKLENPAEALAEYAAEIIRKADTHRVTDSIVEGATRLGDEGALLMTPIERPSLAGGKAFDAALERLQARGLTAEQAREAAEALTELSAPGFSKDNPVVWVLRDGQKQYFRVNSPDLYEAMEAFGRSSILPGVVSAIAPIKRLFTLSSTGANWRFALGTNPARDIPDLIAKNPGALQEMGGALANSVGELFGKSQFAEVVARRGAGSSSLWFQPQNARAAQRAFAPTTAGQRAGARFAETAWVGPRALETVATTVERAPRFAAARAAYNQGLKDWGNIDDALALAARKFNTGTVDFRLRPGSPAAQFLNDVVPFFGAAAKGTARYGELWQTNPGRATAQAMTTMAATTLEYMMSKKGDREKFVDRLPQERARALIFGNTRIPLQQEQAVIAATTRLGLAQLEKDDPQAFAQLAIAVANALPPVSIPPLNVAFGLARNESFFGPIETGRMQRLPAEERRSETTPVTYTALSRALRRGQEALGVENPRVLSPRQLEFIAREGGLGPFAPGVTAMTDVLAQRAMGAATPSVPRESQGLRPLFNVAGAFRVRPEPTTTASEEWFYTTRRRAEEETARFRQIEKGLEEGTIAPENLQQAVAQSGGTASDVQLVRSRQLFKDSDRILQALREDTQRALATEGLSEENRRKILDDSRAMENRLYRIVRKTYLSEFGTRR